MPIFKENDLTVTGSLSSAHFYSIRSYRSFGKYNISYILVLSDLDSDPDYVSNIVMAQPEFASHNYLDSSKISIADFFNTISLSKLQAIISSSFYYDHHHFFAFNI